MRLLHSRPHFVDRYGRLPQPSLTQVLPPIVITPHPQAMYRQSIYQANVERIKDHNEKPDNTFVLGANQFADLTADEWSALVGTAVTNGQHATSRIC